jgi:hypothetical protein
LYVIAAASETTYRNQSNRPVNKLVNIGSAQAWVIALHPRASYIEVKIVYT